MSRGNMIDFFQAVSRDVLLKEYEKKGKEYVFYYSRVSTQDLRSTLLWRG